MKSEYSDSLNPCGIGTGFFITLFILIVAGKIGQFLLSHFYPSIFENYGDYVYNGLMVLLIIVFLLGIPILRNKKKSVFEQSRRVQAQYDGMATIQGGGAIFRLLLYDDGIEIRAFYNTYFIPFSKIHYFSIEEDGYFVKSKRLIIKTGIRDIPEYISIGADENKFWDFVKPIMAKINK